MANMDDVEQILEKLNSSLGATNEAISSFRQVITQFNSTTGNTDDFLSDFNHNLGTSNRELNDSSKKLEKFKNAAQQAKTSLTSSFQSIGEGSESGAKALKGFVDGIGNAVSGLAGALPGMIGNVLGGLATAITSAISAAFGFVEQLSSTNKAISEAGYLFGSTGAGAGIDELNKMALEAGVPMSSLTEAVKLSNDSLRLFAGGPTTGLKSIVSGFKQLKNANEDQLDGLYKLGYTTEEIMAGMADFGAAAKMAGKNLDTKELAEGTAKYLRVQRELTKLTGVEAKDAKAKAEALKSDIAYRRMLQEVGGDNAKTLETMLSQVNESYQPLVKTLLTGGQVTDQNMALLEQALGKDFVDKVRGIGDEARAGVKLDPEVVTEEFKSALIRATDSVDAWMSQYSAATIQTIMNKGGPFAGFLEMLGPVYKDITASREAAGNTTDNANAVAEGTGQIAKALPEVEKAALTLRSIMYTLGASMMSLLAPAVEGLASFTDKNGSKFQESIAGFTTTVNEVQDTLAQPIDPEGKNGFKNETERMKKINELLGKTVGGFLEGDGQGGMYQRLFDTLGNTIEKAITTGLSKGFDAVLNKFNPLASATPEEAKAAVADTKALDVLKDAVAGKGARTSSTGQMFIMNAEARNALDQYVKVVGAEAIKEIQKLGVDVKDAAGRPEFFVKGKSTLPNYAPPPKAMGDIIPPTPGGKIIKVAEAYEHEIVAPAKRGADGKLGLEVSGAMLDNSRLLQSLVKINEGQASLIAGLNNKMENMTNTMDKLVTEQRQANRLAV